MNNNYPYAPQNYAATPEFIRKVVASVNNAMKGKTNNTGEITLTPSATSSVFTDNFCNSNSVVLLVPVTANAANNASGLYVTAGDKTFTVNHSSSAQTDKTFRYVIIG